VFYRLRIYDLVPDNAEVFHEFFVSRLLPVQLRHGARLVGRWQTDDDRVVGVWEYDSREDYDRISDAVRSDPDSIAAQAYRRSSLPQLFTKRDEGFIISTVPQGTDTGWSTPHRLPQRRCGRFARTGHSPGDLADELTPPGGGALGHIHVGDTRRDSRR
jgi:hypothetical protein